MPDNTSPPPLLIYKNNLQPSGTAFSDLDADLVPYAPIPNYRIKLLIKSYCQVKFIGYPQEKEIYR